MREGIAIEVDSSICNLQESEKDIRQKQLQTSILENSRKHWMQTKASLHLHPVVWHHLFFQLFWLKGDGKTLIGNREKTNLPPSFIRSWNEGTGEHPRRQKAGVQNAPNLAWSQWKEQKHCLFLDISRRLGIAVFRA